MAGDDDREALGEPSARGGAGLDTIRAYNEAWNRHDVDELMRLSTEDTVFENTWPPPDGQRLEGAQAVRAFWSRLFTESPHARIEVEELVGCGQRVVMRWRYAWIDGDGRAGHVRGVDVFLVREGKVAEKLSYVKG